MKNSTVMAIIGVAGIVIMCIQLMVQLSMNQAVQLIAGPQCYRDRNGDGRGDPNTAKPLPDDGVPAGWVSRPNDPQDSAPLRIDVGPSSIQELMPYVCSARDPLVYNLTLRTAFDDSVSNKYIDVELEPYELRKCIRVEGGDLSTQGRYTVRTNEKGKASFELVPTAAFGKMDTAKVVLTFRANAKALNATAVVQVVLLDKCL